MPVDLRAAIKDELGKRAPEIDFDAVDSHADVREAFDIDSMDFLNVVIGLHERLGVDIPEEDYSALATIDGAIAYLERKLSPTKGR